MDCFYWFHSVLQSKRYTRYKITCVFRKAAAQIRIKGATKQKAYLPALSEEKGQREGRILSKSTLPLLPSEPNGACLHSCSSCGKWLQEGCWSSKSSCSWENKNSKGKSWLQRQHMGKKTRKTNPNQSKKINGQSVVNSAPSLCAWVDCGALCQCHWELLRDSDVLPTPQHSLTVTQCGGRWTAWTFLCTKSKHRQDNDLRDQLYDVALLYVVPTKHLLRLSCNGQTPPAFGATKPTNMIFPLGMHLNGYGIFLFYSQVCNAQPWKRARKAFPDIKIPVTQRCTDRQSLWKEV